MSRRTCIPRNLILSTPAYARSRASAIVAPSPVTPSTRPPLVTIAPPRSVAPARCTRTPSRRDASSSPVISSPVFGFSG